MKKCPNFCWGYKMIGLARTTIDANGAIIFHEDSGKSKFYSMTTRVKKVATLDGACVVVNNGFSESDKDFKVAATFTKAQVAAFEYIYELSELITCSTKTGFFLGIISFYENKNGEITFTFIVKERLDE